jgi:hypothetical protein
MGVVAVVGMKFEMLGESFQADGTGGTSDGKGVGVVPLQPTPYE